MPHACRSRVTTLAVVARGAHLDAIRRRGALLLETPALAREASVHAVASLDEAPTISPRVRDDPRVDFSQRRERAIRLRQRTKSSMLQYVERGREPEHRAILGALFEFAELAGIVVPHVLAMNACMELLAQSLAAQAEPG